MEKLGIKLENISNEIEKFKLDQAKIYEQLLGEENLYESECFALKQRLQFEQRPKTAPIRTTMKNARDSNLR